MTARNGLTFLLILFLVGCMGLRLNRPMSARPGDWVMYGGGPSRTNIAPQAIQPPLRAVWQYNAQAGVSGTPLVRDSIMVLGTLHGELQAVNLATGRRLGYKVLEAPVVGTPLLDGSRVILTLSGNSETLLVIDLGSGERIWGVAAGPIESSPLLYEDILYVTTLQGVMLALNKSTGEEAWKFESGAKARRHPIRSSPATDGAVLCFGSDDGNIYGVNRQDGSLIWKTSTGASVFASPMIVAGVAVVGNLNGTIHAVDVQTGAIRWKYETGSKIYAPVSGTRQRVFAGGANGVLHAIDAGNGSPLWKFSAESVISSAPLVTGELLFVGSLDKTLYALESTTGRERWRFAAEGRIKVSPVLWGDYLLVTSEDKYITALRPEGSF